MCPSRLRRQLQWLASPAGWWGSSFFMSFFFFLQIISFCRTWEWGCFFLLAHCALGRVRAAGEAGQVSLLTPPGPPAQPAHAATVPATIPDAALPPSGGHPRSALNPGVEQRPGGEKSPSCPAPPLFSSSSLPSSPLAGSVSGQVSARCPAETPQLQHRLPLHACSAGENLLFLLHPRPSFFYPCPWLLLWLLNLVINSSPHLPDVVSQPCLRFQAHHQGCRCARGQQDVFCRC